MTAAQFVQQRSADPEHLARVVERNRRNTELQQVGRMEEQKIVDDLHVNGVRVSSLWDLVNSKASYSAAIPVLVQHLSKGYSPRTLDGLVRSLIVPEARGRAWSVLEQVVVARKTELAALAPSVLGTLLYALGVLATEEDLPGVLRLVGDVELGMYRTAMLSNAPKFKCSPSTFDMVSAFVPDPAIARDFRKFLAGLSLER